LHNRGIAGKIIIKAIITIINPHVPAEIIIMEMLMKTVIMEVMEIIKGISGIIKMNMGMKETGITGADMTKGEMNMAITNIIITGVTEMIHTETITGVYFSSECFNTTETNITFFERLSEGSLF
jgi:hypothetical protein